MQMTRLYAALVLIGMLLIAGCMHAPTAKTEREAQLDVMTYNIRLDLASDGPNAWSERRTLVRDLIRYEAPAILGMQEVLLPQKRYLEKTLPAYSFIGVGRDDGEEAGEFSPLAWRRDMFEMTDSGTFWLSPTPDVPGKGWDAAYPRIAAWAILERRDGRGKLRVLNTHFDHVGAAAKVNAAKLISHWINAGPGKGLPTIVMGDFNSDPDSEAYQVLTSGPLVDSRSASIAPPYGPPGTFTGFDIAQNAGMPIDHIFLSPDILVDRYAVITQHWGGRLPSDHYPVSVVLRPPDT